MSSNSSFEMNKIFAAILVAGITAMFAGFLAEKLVHPKELKEDAVAIDGGEVEVGGAVQQAGPEPIMALIASADIAKGEKLSKACAACHSFDQGGPNKVGPNLWGVVGNSKAAHSGYEYSAALKSMGGAWGYLELNKFLWKPKAYMPGTKMNYNGIKNPEDRAAMIAWLRTLGSTDPLPNAAEIAAEEAELAPPAAVEEPVPAVAGVESEEAPAVASEPAPAAAP